MDWPHIGEDPHQSACPEILGTFQTFLVFQPTIFVFCNPQVSTVCWIPSMHQDSKTEANSSGSSHKGWIIEHSNLSLPLEYLGAEIIFSPIHSVLSQGRGYADCKPKPPFIFPLIPTWLVFAMSNHNSESGKTETTRLLCVAPIEVGILNI